jgi:hypothetical protein
MDTTRTVFWREFSKNLADDSGFWWMDLGGGWFDSPDVMNEFSKLVKVADKLRMTEHKSQSDVLMLVDNDCICKMNISQQLRLGFMEDFLCELHMSGPLVDVYRLGDLRELDLDQYKLIIFAYAFEIDGEMREFIKNIPQDKTLMFNYTAGIISENEVSLQNVENLTGVSISPFDEPKYEFPSVKISSKENIEIIDEQNGVALVGAVKRKNGGTNIVNLKPFAHRTLLRKITDMAGCHAYAPVGNTVYGDNRFIAVFPSEDGTVDITLKEKLDYINLVTNEEFKNTDKISLKADNVTPIFLCEHEK